MEYPTRHRSCALFIHRNPFNDRKLKLDSCIPSSDLRCAQVENKRDRGCRNYMTCRLAFNQTSTLHLRRVNLVPVSSPGNQRATRGQKQNKKRRERKRETRDRGVGFVRETENFHRGKRDRLNGVFFLFPFFFLVGEHGVLLSRLSRDPLEILLVGSLGVPEGEQRCRSILKNVRIDVISAQSDPTVNKITRLPYCPTSPVMISQFHRLIRGRSGFHI